MQQRRVFADLTVESRPRRAGAGLTITLDEEDEMRRADYVIQRVADLGVKHGLTVPGSEAMHVMDTLWRAQSRQPRPRRVPRPLGPSHQSEADGVVMVVCSQAPR